MIQSRSWVAGKQWFCKKVTKKGEEIKYPERPKLQLSTIKDWMSITWEDSIASNLGTSRGVEFKAATHATQLIFNLRALTSLAHLAQCMDSNNLPILWGSLAAQDFIRAWDWFRSFEERDYHLCVSVKDIAPLHARGERFENNVIGWLLRKAWGYIWWLMSKWALQYPIMYEKLVEFGKLPRELCALKLVIGFWQ